ncbi:MAG TPA: hypothetical protein G4O15_10985 [Dehalococcoidia bacterium]|nr:hypothetical protein [Dehalococcoidia bacterium]
MNELELLQQITDKRSELEKNRAANVSSSLLKLQEEEIRELEYIFASSDQKRLEMRFFMDQCDKGKEEDYVD